MRGWVQLRIIPRRLILVCLANATLATALAIAPNLTGTTKIVFNRHSPAKSATVNSLVTGEPKPPKDSTNTKSRCFCKDNKVRQAIAKST